jgi:hypothetical protein
MNAFLLSRMGTQIPVQQDDGTISMMKADEARAYAVPRGTMRVLFDVPLKIDNQTENALIRVWALKYTKNGKSAVALLAEPYANHELISGISADQQDLGETEITLLRRIFLETLTRVQENVQSTQKELFAWNIPILKIDPAVLEMKGMAALLAPSLFKDEYANLFGNTVFSFIPDPKAGGITLSSERMNLNEKYIDALDTAQQRLDIDRLGDLFDVRAADDQTQKGTLDGSQETSNIFPREQLIEQSLRLKLSAYEPAVVINNAEAVSRPKADIVSRINNIGKLLPSPYDESSLTGKLTYLSQRLKELKNDGVNTVIISPFDRNNPFAIDISIIDEAAVTKEYRGLAALKALITESTEGALDTTSFRLNFWNAVPIFMLMIR